VSARAALLTLAVTLASALASAPAQAKPVCQEDEACWNWATMGDLHRGVRLPDGRRLRVGPCQYRELLLRSAVMDEPRDRLRGDWWAREHGCDRWR
jgi:hypothetical protein